jgi:hypothetical protein
MTDRRVAGYHRAGGSQQEEPRVCLKCGSEFISAGPWNRVCGRCKASESHSPTRHRSQWGKAKALSI